jgi:hypothetical protein
MTNINGFDNDAYTPAQPCEVVLDSTGATLQTITGKAIQSTAITYPAPVAGISVTVTSGVAQQNNNGVRNNYYLTFGGNLGGNVKVEIGSTSACANMLIPTTTANQIIPVCIPPYWWFKITVGGGATIISPTYTLLESI